MANSVSLSGTLSSGSPNAAATNNPNISGQVKTDEYILVANPNANNQPLTLAIVGRSTSSRNIYLEVVRGSTLVADSASGTDNVNLLIAPGQPTDDPGQDNPNIPNSLNLSDSVAYRVRLLRTSNSVIGYSINASVPQGDIALIAVNAEFTLRQPTADSNTNGDNTGITPTNAASGEFFNLSDVSDSVTLDGANRGIVRGLAGKDRIQGTIGNDIINGNGGADTILGEPGNDDLRGGSGSDSLLGGSGDDSIFGNNNNDTLEGGDGNDLLRGGRDSDVLSGNDGNDTLIGDFGFDLLTGGIGNDLFVLRGGEAGSTDIQNADLITDFLASGDRLGLTNSFRFEDLVFIPTKITFGGSETNSTAIYHFISGTYLATVRSVTPDVLTASLFTSTTF